MSCFCRGRRFMKTPDRVRLEKELAGFPLLVVCGAAPGTLALRNDPSAPVPADVV